MTAPVFTLTVDVLDLSGRPQANIAVTATLKDQQLEYPVGDGPSTVLPQPVKEATSAQGIAVLQLLPSADVGNYVIQVGDLSREITMPDRNVRLSELGDPSRQTLTGREIVALITETLGSDTWEGGGGHGANIPAPPADGRRYILAEENGALTWTEFPAPPQPS